MLPGEIFSGWWPEGHVQGIALDAEKGHMYFSFTTILLKTDLQGNPLGSVRRLAGHLGCISFDPHRRRVYGSLELKHDVIGAGIIDRTGWNPSNEDNFYLVSFDADRIDRMGMDAEADGVMKAVWLAEVIRDYKGTDPVSGKPHVYGCSGIDGTEYGPVFGTDGPNKIMVAYGIYSDTQRSDNDYQVIMQYDPSVVDLYGQPLCQQAPHHSGPEGAEQRYYLYTGNTTYGIQNLSYEPCSRRWLVAVYRGKKPQFGNPPMFMIDGTQKPVKQTLKGREEAGLVLMPAAVGAQDSMGVWGIDFPYGATGICPLGDGTVYFSQNMKNAENKTFASKVVRYGFSHDNWQDA